MADLNTLLEALPLCANAAPLQDGAPAGVRYISDPREEFVVPPFSVDAEPLGDAQVVVISAPAAVGKSMLAEFLALRTGGVLWDLAQARVGNNFAVGTLAASHGAAKLGDVLQQLWTGQFLVVADALDEARLRVTFDAFTAFLDDLSSQLLKGITAGQPGVILLARRESAEFAAEWLKDELDVRVATAEIEFFDRPGAVEFIEKQLEADGKDPENGALLEARNTIFARTLDLLGVDPDSKDWPLDPARRFLGYAPVLVAIARYLSRGGNPQRIAEDLKGHAAPEAMWTFLAELLDDMLGREQEKFVGGFRERFGPQAAAAGFDSWNELFTSQEQCAWLVSEALGTEPPGGGVPQSLEDEYRAQVRGWMPEHSFIGASSREFASPVFADYVYSRALQEGDDQGRAAVHARAAEASYRPTEMLARFFFELSDELTAAGDDVAILYESLLAAEEAGQQVALDLIAVPGDGEHLAFIQLGAQEPLRLTVAYGDAPVRFFTRLARARIFTDNPVHLGSHGRLVELGPSVLIIAPEVQILGESIAVREPNGGLGVVVTTGRLTAVDHAVRFVRGAKHFGVQSREPLRYPFADRSVTVRWDDVDFPLTDREKQAANALFRLAAMFKTEGYDGLGSYAEPIDRVATRNETFALVLSSALAKGIVEKEGNIYKFHPDQLGLDFSAVQTHALSAEARSFVKEACSMPS